MSEGAEDDDEPRDERVVFGILTLSWRRSTNWLAILLGKYFSTHWLLC